MEKFDKELFDLGYPKNLVREIFGEVFDDYPDDLEGSVEYALYFLDDETREIIKRRFRDALTDRGLGKILGMPNNVVRDKIRDGLNKLRMPSISRFIQFGVKGAIDLEVRKAFWDDKTLEKCISYALGQDIDNIGLSGRAHNSLVRFYRSKLGSKAPSNPTVSDIIHIINNTGFKKIRNCGRVSQVEIINKLCELGLRDKLTIDIDKILEDK